MRAVLQRVSSASVTIDAQVNGAIGAGLLVLLGVGQGDTEREVEWMVDKISGLRIFEDDAGKMNRSLLDTSKAMLAVSQFTLYADTRKGRRPSFVDACEPTEAKRLYALFCERARAKGLTVAEGIFAADMKVALVNDGPVTICLDSNEVPSP
ncbi:MAG: D-tyrosyl-tRNA(Tyr) deacylase [Myxococcaceae bacterium]|nr:D-tyrosyl-tRNA(Tyr) deacylase [Myxococcaceae bacterium]